MNFKVCIPFHILLYLDPTEEIPGMLLRSTGYINSHLFEICRNFAIEEAPWASTPLQQRKDTPSWFLELPMWVRLTT